MKYLLALSLVAFLVGCGNEEQKQQTHTQTKQAVEKKVQEKPVQPSQTVEKKAQVVHKEVQKETVAKVDGATLFQGCAGCHGSHGEKKALGKSETIQGWSVAKVQSALEEYKKGTRNLYGMGALMKAQTSKLSQEQIKELAEYISKL